ncbi:MAG: hypothetical protein ACXW18_05755 [Pyrinomonadaceae bacterium]
MPRPIPKTKVLPPTGKIFLALLVLVCSFTLVSACSVSAHPKDELHIGVRLTTGEHSRDSSSETTTITVERGTIVWERTFTGRRRGTPPSRKEFKLSSADKQNLLKLIRSNNLLVTDSLELPRKSSNFRYFEISVELTLDGKKGAISISGMRTAVEVKEEKLYQNTMTLVKELYRIVDLQDDSMTFEDLVDEPKNN